MNGLRRFATTGPDRLLFFHVKGADGEAAIDGIYLS